jgi:hypothetical protein
LNLQPRLVERTVCRFCLLKARLVTLQLPGAARESVFIVNYFDVLVKVHFAMRYLD